MSALLEMLASQVGGAQLSQIASQLGIDESQTQRAMEAALPAVIGGLARNAAASPDGASALAGALDRDHDGSILDDVGGLLSMFGGGGSSSGGGGGLGGLLGAAAGSLLGGGRKQQKPSGAANGAGILSHVFGSQLGGVEQVVGKASGLDGAKAGQLLAMIAPLVMGALGKVKKEKNLDADGLAGLLGGERKSLDESGAGLGGLMGMLDADGDGSITDDVTKIGAGLLGKFLSGKR